MTDNAKRGEDALQNLNRELKSRNSKTPIIVSTVVAGVAITATVAGLLALNNSKDDAQNLAEDTTAASTVSEQAPEVAVLSGQRENALPAQVSCSYTEVEREGGAAGLPPEENISAKGTLAVEFITNHGPIEMELSREAAPCTVNSIEYLVSSGFYDDTICHRATSGGLNVLQCGDPTGTGAGGPGYQYDNEYPTDEYGAEAALSSVTYPRGSIAMANAGVGTNGSQFFLNYDDSTLQPNYTYFGDVTAEGQQTLDAIAELGIEGGASDGAPAEEVRITSAKVLKS